MFLGIHKIKSNEERNLLFICNTITLNKQLVYYYREFERKSNGRFINKSKGVKHEISSAYITKNLIANIIKKPIRFT